MKSYLSTLMFVLSPLVLGVAALYWFLGMASDRYFGVAVLGIILGVAYLRSMR